jgi:hypothetical protein
MKKTMIVLGIALFAFSSCKKEYTCSCSAYTYMTITAEAADYDLGKQSKADAEEACESLQDINVILDPAATCEL